MYCLKAQIWHFDTMRTMQKPEATVNVTFFNENEMKMRQLCFRGILLNLQNLFDFGGYFLFLSRGFVLRILFSSKRSLAPVTNVSSPGHLIF